MPVSLVDEGGWSSIDRFLHVCEGTTVKLMIWSVFGKETCLAKVDGRQAARTIFDRRKSYAVPSFGVEG